MHFDLGPVIAMYRGPVLALGPSEARGLEAHLGQNLTMLCTALDYCCLP